MLNYDFNEIHNLRNDCKLGCWKIGDYAITPEDYLEPLDFVLLKYGRLDATELEFAYGQDARKLLVVPAHDNLEIPDAVYSTMVKGRSLSNFLVANLLRPSQSELMYLSATFIPVIGKMGKYYYLNFKYVEPEFNEGGADFESFYRGLILSQEEL